MRRVAAALVVVGAATATARPVHGVQEARDSVPAAAPPTRFWSVAVGLSDVSSDVDPPGSILELGAEWRPEAFLGVTASGGLGQVSRDGTCRVAGFDTRCVRDSTVPSIAVGSRLYLLRRVVDTWYVQARVGWQGDGLGRYAEIGSGFLVATLAGGSVGIELRRRFGWSEAGADGRIYVFRAERAFGPRRRSGSESR